MLITGRHKITHKKTRVVLSCACLIYLIYPVLLLAAMSCVTEFIPQVSEERELLVVEGLITDQPEPYTVKLSKASPFGKKSEVIPLGNCMVSVTDNLGNRYYLNEQSTGTYVSDPAYFRGVVGRSYSLNIKTDRYAGGFTFESSPVEMIPVPPIDSIYYEKTVIQEKTEDDPQIDGCQIYLDTSDPENINRYFRWDFDECWILRLLWPVDNMKCWVYDKSRTIHIKNTTSLDESAIEAYPLTYITNETDRLKMEYSILVNQYSMNEEEYNFWEKLKTLTEQVGGLYDVVPYSITSNLYCLDDQSVKVLGYFSVSAKSSKRIFIKDKFEGIIDRYADCVTDTLPTDYPPSIDGINVRVWALLVNKSSFTSPGYTIITDRKGCADCTDRGTTTEPDFWKENKK